MYKIGNRSRKIVLYKCHQTLIIINCHDFVQRPAPSTQHSTVVHISTMRTSLTHSLFLKVGHLLYGFTTN